MKKLALTVIILISCKFQLTAQTSSSETKHLLGRIEKQDLSGSKEFDWFLKNYESYEVKSKITEKIGSSLSDYTLTVFMGTWCGDSKRQVPRLIKILETVNYPMEQLTIIGVSRKPDMYKQSPQHEEAGLNIHRVPTIIFYKDGKETNRIVEEPVESLENDILNIVSKNNYKSNYQIVTAVNNILKSKGIKGLNRKTKKLLKQYDGKVTNMFELNTYARVLYTANKTDEAIAVFKFNTKLFPNEPRTYMSLANTLGVNGQKQEAISTLEKAIKKFPDNKDLKQNLEVVKSN